MPNRVCEERYLIFAKIPSVSFRRNARTVWSLALPSDPTLSMNALIVSSSGASNATTVSYAPGSSIPKQIAVALADLPAWWPFFIRIFTNFSRLWPNFPREPSAARISRKHLSDEMLLHRFGVVEPTVIYRELASP